MHTLAILLKSSWHGWVNSIRYTSEARRKKIAEIIGFFILIIALFLMGRAVFRAAETQLGDAYGILQAINIFMTLGVFILAKDAMEGSLKQLYEAPDTSLLLSSPLPPSTVFGFKLIQLIASNVPSMLIWLFPPWIAFGRLFHLPWHFYVALIPTCFCLFVVIMGEISIIMMLIVRFFSSRRMIQFLKILGTTIGVAAGLLLAMSFLALDKSDQIAQFILTRLKAPASDWYPHVWAAKLMMSWLPESGEHPLRWAGQLIGASAGVPVLATILASKIYPRSWEYARRVEVGAKRKQKKVVEFSLVGRGKIRSMMTKDFLVFVRNKGRVTMIVMLTLIILMVMFGITYEMRKNGGQDTNPLFGLTVQIMVYSVMITLGLTWGGFKSESKTWWLLKSGPISPEVLFKGKFLIATLCAIVYANVWILLGLILFQIPIWLWLPMLSGTTIITAAAIAFNTAIGTLPWVAEMGKTDWDSGKRPVLRLATILLTMVLNGVILIVPTVTLEFFVLNDLLDDMKAGILGHVSISLWQQITIVAILCMMIGVWGASYLLGKRSLRKLLE